MKKIWMAGAALLAAVTLSLSLVGCGGGVNVNYNAVEWKGGGAQIYDGETLLAETVTNACLLRLDAGTHSLSLRRDGKAFANFEYTVPRMTETVCSGSDDQKLSVYGDGIYFSASEHLILDYRTAAARDDAFPAPIYLAENVKKVSVLASRTFMLHCSFILQRRAQDVEFEFERINLVGLDDVQHAIAFDDEVTPQGKIILSFFGNGNSIASGFEAANDKNGSDQGWVGTGGNGGNGENGGCAVKGGEIVILSETDVAFTGTNGGNGGNGGDATVLAKAGNGGNGGNGGAAIEGTSVTLFMVEGVFTATAGTGGKAGSAGGRALGGAGSNGSAGITPESVNAESKEALRGSFGE